MTDDSRNSPAHVDLSKLLDDRVIAQSTYDWLAPKLAAELADLEEILAAARERKSNPFCTQEDDSDEDEEDWTTHEVTLLRGIEGTNTMVGVVTDTNSTGHGNKVWHASIATCRYLKEQFLPRLSETSGTEEAKLFTSLELGAGTAVPSWFLGALLSSDHTNGLPARSLLRITDAKEHRNLLQILRSLELNQRLARDGDESNSSNGATITIECHPHNWGDPIDFCQVSEEAHEDIDRTELPEHDLVMVSDCLYNPEGHRPLLTSLSKTLALGGTAVVSFSLHGNVNDAAIWEFVEAKLPQTTQMFDDTTYRLSAECVSGNQPREGWNMESTMASLDMVTEGMKPERWMAYVYEVTWEKAAAKSSAEPA